MGIQSESLFTRAKNDLPGWFRASKNWDLLAFERDQLAVALELKSISSSFGNNLNNRAEEAIGEATDAKFAVERGLLNRSLPPLFAYALIVRDCEESRMVRSDPTNSHFDPDRMFENTSYADRAEILCRRVRRDNIFGAVWFVLVDPEKGTVTEPESGLSYDAFMSEIRGHIGAFKC